MNGLIGYVSAFLGWEWDDVSDKRRAYSPLGEESRLDGLFCSASDSHPVSGFTEVSSSHPKMLC